MGSGKPPGLPQDSFGDEMKYTLYGGGPKMIRGRDVSEQKKLARRSSIARTVPKMQKLYEGAAGSSSKLLFFVSDIAKSPTYASQYFSENLHFRPVGVPGLGYDAQPKPNPGAAGMTSTELFFRDAERRGIMSDEADLRGLRIPSMTEAERKIASQSSIYLGGAGNHAYGIPDRDPAPFVGAAGLTSSQQSQINNRLNDTESLGANTAAAPASPTGAGGSPPKSKVSPGNVRRLGHPLGGPRRAWRRAAQACARRAEEVDGRAWGQAMGGHATRLRGCGRTVVVQQELD